MPNVRYEFVGNSQNTFRTAFIIGAPRVGKTLIGTLISTCNRVEYAEEPWWLSQLPPLTDLHAESRPSLQRMFAAAVSDLFRESVLLRNANFRPGDLSSIYRKKSLEEIQFRLTQLHNQKDIDAYRDQDLLVITLSEYIALYTHFLLKAVPTAKILHVIRNMPGVVQDTLHKRWYADALLRHPVRDTLYKIYTTEHDYYLPLQVRDGDEEFFLAAPETDRCAYLWCRMMEPVLETFGKNTLLLRYEDFTRNPSAEMKRIQLFLDITDGYFTRLELAKIEYRAQPPMPLIQDVTLRQKTQTVMKQLGYGEH